MNNRKAIMKVSTFYLREALGLPDDCEIVMLYTNLGDTLEMVIACPSFPEVGVGVEFPVVNPTFKRHNSLTELVNWHYPKEEKNFCQEEVKKQFYCKADMGMMNLCKGFKFSYSSGYSETCDYWASLGICKNKEMQKRD